MGSVKLALLLGCLLFDVVRGADNCNVLPGKENDPCSFVDDDEGQYSVLDDQFECEKHLDYCCWDGMKCHNKRVGTGELPEQPKKRNPFKKPNAAKVKATGLRFLPLGGICLPPPPFPGQCKFRKNEPYVLSPPIDIPYCVRIPCSLDRGEQREFDRNHFKCGSSPGCYFDVELYEYREAFGPAVLAGVPVCHLAIRNAVFHREAQKVVAAQGAWNPYFTNCLLNKFKQEMESGSKDCRHLGLLRLVKTVATLAGWEGIVREACIILDACPDSKYGCVYPIDLNNLVVKSGQRFKFNRFEVIYGRPKCQHFNNENSYEILKSYHRCLSSGCSVDLNIVAKYYHYLFDIGEQMTPEDHWDYWNKAMDGEFKPNNLDEGIHWEWDKTFKRKLGTAPPGPPGSPPGPPSGPKSPDNPFGIPGLGRRKRNTHQTHPEQCGFVYRRSGGRPCRPPQVPNFNVNSYCPYKPFYVPRFKRLQGSFKGCCEVNLCYLSIRDIRKMHSGPSFYYTQWSTFSECSQSCDGGTQYRKRYCVSHDQTLCTENEEETRSCGRQPCPYWGRWSRWGPCPGRCGIQSRKRTCIPPDGGCLGQGNGYAEEVRTCMCTG